MIGVIAAGGTIACEPGEGGYMPAASNTLEALLKETAHLVGLEICLEPLGAGQTNAGPGGDSSTFGSSTWLALHRQIEALTEKVDGIMILHGTDTMTHTASALSYLAPARRRSVVLTGSQLPAGAPGSDAKANIRLALKAAAGDFGDLLGDTYIAFGGRVLRGNRATKLSSHAAEAFIADMSFLPGRSVERPTWELQRPVRAATRASGFSGPVISLNITPEMPLDILGHLLDQRPPGGLLLNLYGIGSAPSAERLACWCDRLTQAGWLCLGRSQCVSGAIDWSVYAVTEAFRSSALIDGSDIAHDAAVVKLMAAMDGGLGADWLRTNVAGELTPRHPEMAA